MVRSIARRLPLLALAAFIGAVEIAPRRRGGPDRREDAPSAPATSVSPAPAPGFSPSASGPASRFSPSTRGHVRIHRREGLENVPRRHYWHGSGAHRYSHYYDGRVHWYGYPFGASFFWMRPHGDFWWTWDARFSRWSYWHDGFWWWPGPGGVQFVYVNDGYYPYDAVRRSAYAAPPAPPADARGGWTSPDGRRLIEVSGPDAEAILYDKTQATPAYIRFLGKEVQKVRFSSAAPNSPATILIEFRGGAFALFDYDGRRLDTTGPAPVKKTPPAGDVPPSPPPPEDLPPPPQ